MIFALVLLAAAASRVEVIPSQTIQVSPGNWGQFPINLEQRPAGVDATFAVESGTDHMRMALLRREDLERLLNEEHTGVLASTEPGRTGSLHYQVRQPGEYVMVLDNRAERTRTATVRVNVWLDFAAPPAPGVTVLSPARRLAVVLISCVAFFGVVMFSARKLWLAVKR